MYVHETGTFSRQKVHERDTFSFKVIYKRIMGWTSGQSIPVQNFVEYLPWGMQSNMQEVILGLV